MSALEGVKHWVLHWGTALVKTLMFTTFYINRVY